MSAAMQPTYLEPLYVIPPHQAPIAYWRRRLVVGALALVVLLLASAGLRSAAGALGIVPASGSERAPASNVSPARTYVVQPGDTVWKIARRLQPQGEVRPLVDRIVKANGGASVQIGDRLEVPVP
jgi:nucleoid-associated protein YgaU